MRSQRHGQARKTKQKRNKKGKQKRHTGNHPKQLRKPQKTRKTKEKIEAKTTQKDLTRKGPLAKNPKPLQNIFLKTARIGPRIAYMVFGVIPHQPKTEGGEKMKIVKTGKTWSIVDVKTGEIVEGGFFSKESARKALDEILREKNGLER